MTDIELSKHIDSRIQNDREFIIINKDIILEAINNPTEILNILDDIEINIIFEQAFDNYYIDQIGWDRLIEDKTLLFDYIEMDNIHKLLQNQYTYITKIPNIKDLESNGLFDSILTVIETNYDSIINAEIVHEYTDKHLEWRLKNHFYISFEKIEMVLSQPYDFLKILDDDEAIIFLTRLRTYLVFVNDERIQLVKDLINTPSYHIEEVFSSDEIKTMIDKEVELKYLLLKYLTPSKLEEIFTGFKKEFLNVNLDGYLKDAFNKLRDELLSADNSSLIEDQVQTYLISSYNNFVESKATILFNNFKNDFLDNELQLIIETYTGDSNIDEADIVKSIKEQIESYLEFNVNLTDFTILKWIEEEKLN